MRPIIYLHIGASKTASSAIQKFLAININLLEAAGIFVPDSKLTGVSPVTGEHVWYFQDLVNNPDGAETKLVENVKQIVAENPTCQSIVFSAENLSNDNGAAKIVKALTEFFDVKIIFYVRRQDDFLISSWQQWFCKIETDFQTWVSSNFSRGDWRSVCQRWAVVTEIGDMRVRAYEKVVRQEGGILGDFAAAIRYPDPSALRRPESLENPSLCDAVTELVAGKRSLFANIHDNQFYSMLLDLTGNKLLKRKGETSFSIANRAKIVESYREVNEWLCQTFDLADSADELFPDVQKEELHELSANELDREKEEIMLLVFLGLYSRIRRIEQKTKIGRPQEE